LGSTPEVVIAAPKTAPVTPLTADDEAPRRLGARPLPNSPSQALSPEPAPVPVAKPPRNGTFEADSDLETKSLADVPCSKDLLSCYLLDKAAPYLPKIPPSIYQAAGYADQTIGEHGLEIAHYSALAGAVAVNTFKIGNIPSRNWGNTFWGKTADLRSDPLKGLNPELLAAHSEYTTYFLGDSRLNKSGLINTEWAKAELDGALGKLDPGDQITAKFSNAEARNSYVQALAAQAGNLENGPTLPNFLKASGLDDQQVRDLTARQAQLQAQPATRGNSSLSAAVESLNADANYSGKKIDPEAVREAQKLSEASSQVALEPKRKALSALRTSMEEATINPTGELNFRAGLPESLQGAAEPGSLKAVTEQKLNPAGGWKHGTVEVAPDPLSPDQVVHINTRTYAPRPISAIEAAVGNGSEPLNAPMLEQQRIMDTLGKHHADFATQYGEVLRREASLRRVTTGAGEVLPFVAAEAAVTGCHAYMGRKEDGWLSAGIRTVGPFWIGLSGKSRFMSSYGPALGASLYATTYCASRYFDSQ
jgi:hypothetical protein